ncbi:glycoside hydrolase family 15 protein [Symbioplanes lichenis]|uniref:glycoside hydrolase family 15 protein n=1 Tax=Symbioplanes lichenis TaxID=1629072 RepID=UPI00273870CF|nr:glycoside hydrolase family 15 protein [Actinoplanes lichenis]
MAYVQLLSAGVLTLALAGVPAAGSVQQAPGAPGVDEQYLPADKSGIGTSHTLASKVWFTVQKEGGLGEIYFPTADAPSARTLDFVVSDGRTAARAATAADVRTTITDERSLSFRQTFTERHGRWRLTATYASDPARATVLVDVNFAGRDRYDLFAVYDPALANTRGNDSGRTARDTLLATDGATASAFVAKSSGFRGTSDGWTDLLDNGRLDHRYTSAGAGNLVQTAAVRLHRGHATLALGFASTALPTAPATSPAPRPARVAATTPGAAQKSATGSNAPKAGVTAGPTSGDAAAMAVTTATASLRRGFPAIARDYASGWHAYLDGLKRPPATLRTDRERQLWRTSALVLAAAEDKTYRGAFVAAPAMPWAFGTDDPSGPYHLVWSRDLYQVATGLVAAGDVAGAKRALDYLFQVQQAADGSFPQNSKVDGTPFWGGLQLDEVALPIVLAHQLGRTDGTTWDHIRAAADFLVGYEQAPWSPQERWENQSGWSPGTIAAEIAGLVCAADIARRNGDATRAERYLATADDWQARVKDWTLTTTGPYSDRPYFLRLTKDGNPDAGTTYTIGDSGPVNVDQRRVVDPSFLELVRLGVLPADDPDIANSVRVVDAQLGVRTPNGFFWHRASFDGFGEQADGSQWEYGQPDGSLLSRGRLWPLLSGERGEYELALGQPAQRRVTDMAHVTGPGGMLPEQVWDDQPPRGKIPGTPTYSATPLAWTHAQFLRLARDAAAGRILEQPAIVADRYAR